MRLSFLRILSFVAGFVVAQPAPAAPDDILFAADLSPDEESAPTDSPARGRIEIWLERATLKITWTATFADLTSSPLAFGIHGPENPGANAGMQVDLAKGGLKSPVTGSAVLTDGQFQYLITTRMYVNLTTAKYPAGELRGQLRRSRQTRSGPAP